MPLALAAAPPLDHSAPLSPGHAALLAALRHAPHFLSRTPPGTADPAFSDFVRAAALIESEYDQTPGPATGAALGVLRLHQGRLDEAIALLTVSAESGDRTGRTFADLASAVFERGIRDNRVTDMARAARFAELATARGEAPEPRFTRALALERLGLRVEARAAWQQLSRTAPHAWAVEAARHARDLEQPDAALTWKALLPQLSSAAQGREHEAVVAVVRSFPQQVRTEVEDEWLGRWGDLALRDGADAAKVLRHLQRLASALAAVTSDTLLLDSVTALDEATALADQGYPSRLKLLADGHRLYRDARRLQEEERYHLSRPLLEEAIPLFREGHSPFEHWARYRHAVAVYHEPDHPQALALLANLGNVAAVRDPGVLAGHVAWMVGLTHLRLAEWTSALEAFEVAERAFTACREVENRAAIRTLRVWALQPLGRDDAAERELAAVLSDLPRIVKPRRVLNVLSTAIETLQRSGEDSIALYFQDEVLRLANASDNPNWIARAYRQRADLLARTGSAARAEDDLNEALRHAERTSERGEGLNVEIAALQIRARLAASSEPRRALGLLDHAVSFVEANHIRFLLLRLLYDRASVRLALRDHGAAEADLERGLSELERQYREASSDDGRNSLREEGRRLFEMLVRLDVERGATPSAGRAAAERLRLRGLSDTLETATLDITTPDIASPARVPSGTALVEFISLPDRLYSWLALPDRVVFRQEPVGASALALAVGDFVRALRGDDPRAAAVHGGRLGKLLLEPILRELDGVSAVVIVPDRALWSLPFSALTLPDGSYLVQRYALTIAASSTHRAASTPTPSPEAFPGSILLVGVAGAPGDEVLPGVAAELDQVADLYQQRTVLRGVAATPDRVLQELPRHAYFHFAGHAREAPAGLLLHGGALTAADLRRQRLDRPFLAVLAGCRSASGTISGARGAQSLARAFLSRGVPNVIASLWDVDDGSAWRFSVAFHSALRRGLAPAAALRSAQESLLGSDDPTLSRPVAWATYQLLAGGVAGGIPGR